MQFRESDPSRGQSNLVIARQCQIHGQILVKIGEMDVMPLLLALLSKYYFWRQKSVVSVGAAEKDEGGSYQQSGVGGWSSRLVCGPGGGFRCRLLEVLERVAAGSVCVWGGPERFFFTMNF